MNLLFIDGEVVEAATETIANEEIITIADESAAAEATAAQPAPAGSGSFWIMIIAMIAIMYFFMWRPESKRRKQIENLRNGLKKGDRIITAGGIYGTVKEVHPTSLLIEVDSNVTLRIDKN
ncbi:MAG: preprotein translocase subunit YajC, partial [Alistipes sp.]|nr:preprotein translocase subunit YajC [Alistipes sp.]